MNVVIPVDIQKAFDDHAYWGGERNNSQLENNVSRIFEAARRHGVPLVHIKHNSTSKKSLLHPANAGNAFKPEAQPADSETVIEKSVNSAFIGTNLESLLNDMKADRLIIFGITTDHCVSTTTRMAANLGFDVHLVADASATFPKTLPGGRRFEAQTVHDVNLASLHGEFAEVVETRDILSSWE